MESKRTVTLWSADGLTVQARRGTDNHDLVIFGADLKSPALFGSDVTEYEYGLTVAEADIPKVLSALGAAEQDDVLDVLERTGRELVKAGESTWLAEHGIEFEFWSRLE